MSRNSASSHANGSAAAGGGSTDVANSSDTTIRQTLQERMVRQKEKESLLQQQPSIAEKIMTKSKNEILEESYGVAIPRRRSSAAGNSASRSAGSIVEMQEWPTELARLDKLEVDPDEAAQEIITSKNYGSSSPSLIHSVPGSTRLTTGSALRTSTGRLKTRISYAPYGNWVCPNRLRKPPDWDPDSTDIYVPRNQYEYDVWNLALRADPWIFLFFSVAYFALPYMMYEKLWLGILRKDFTTRTSYLAWFFSNDGAASNSDYAAQALRSQYDFDGEYFTGEKRAILAEISEFVTPQRCCLAAFCFYLLLWGFAKMVAIPFPHMGSSNLAAWGKGGRIIFFTKHGQLFQLVHYGVMVLAFTALKFRFAESWTSDTLRWGISSTSQTRPWAQAGFFADAFDTTLLFVLRTSAQMSFFTATMGSAVTILYALLVVPDAGFQFDCKRYDEDFGFPLRRLQDQSHNVLLVLGLIEVTVLQPGTNWLQVSGDASSAAWYEPTPMKKLAKMGDGVPKFYFLVLCVFYQCFYFVGIVAPNYWDTGNWPYGILRKVAGLGIVKGWVPFLLGVGMFCYTLFLILVFVFHESVLPHVITLWRSWAGALV
ncbi:unnamed protein product [Amoebophrya sp. A120]|nr:unnamed protein product [Amoebophrya sp. A120]|eukprot:GSA120T00023999001.1